MCDACAQISITHRKQNVIFLPTSKKKKLKKAVTKKKAQISL